MKQLILKIRDSMIRPLLRRHEIVQASIGKSLSFSLKNMLVVNELSDSGFRVFSQFDEDGIIEWLLQHIPISSKKFIEFGVENYTESNTRLLLENRNWDGLLFDSSQENIDYIIKDAIYWRHSLKAKCAFVTPENINQLLESNGFTGNVGLLSIDAGGQDYWIWKAIEVISPDIVVCEYNSILGDTRPLTVPSSLETNGGMNHYSGLYWGASHVAFELLGHEKGYTMLGSNLGGHNCFLVKNNLAPYVTDLIKLKKPLPSKYRDSRDENGRLNYLSGRGKLDLIAHLPVLNLNNGNMEILGNIQDLYSSDWY